MSRLCLLLALPLVLVPLAHHCPWDSGLGVCCFAFLACDLLWRVGWFPWAAVASGCVALVWLPM